MVKKRKALSRSAVFYPSGETKVAGGKSLTKSGRRQLEGRPDEPSVLVAELPEPNQKIVVSQPDDARTVAGDIYLFLHERHVTGSAGIGGSGRAVRMRAGWLKNQEPQTSLACGS